MLARTVTVEQVGIVHLGIAQIILCLRLQHHGLLHFTGSLQATVVLLNLLQYGSNGVGGLSHGGSCQQKEEETYPLTPPCMEGSE